MNRETKNKLKIFAASTAGLAAGTAVGAGAMALGNAHIIPSAAAALVASLGGVSTMLVGMGKSAEFLNADLGQGLKSCRGLQHPVNRNKNCCDKDSNEM